MDLKEYILSEAGVADVFFQKIPFGGDEENEDELRKLAGFPKNKKEPDTKNEYTLYQTLANWVNYTSPALANKLYSFKTVIEQAAKKYPKLFLPKTPPGTILYRGLKRLSPAMLTKLRKEKNWQKIEVDYETYYICKTPVQYSPRQKVQSWSTDEKMLRNFAESAVLMTRQNKEYLFNQKVFEILFEDNENEILHFGKEYKSKVFIALTEYKYETLLDTKSVPNWKSVAKTLAL